MKWWAALALLLAAPSVAAQTPAAPAVAVDPAMKTTADALIPILAGGGDFALFAPSFQQAVPEPQFRAIATQLRDSFGAPERVVAIAAEGPWQASVTVAYQRGSVVMRLSLDPAAPHRVIGLLVTGTATNDDTPAKLLADVKALPGAAGVGVYRLGTGAPTPLVEWRGTEDAPLGSAFKLWLLAEASRQVSAGERRWADVVPIGPPSLPSGITQNWPAGTPITLQALATLMISISDNTAADTMLATLGRAKVEAMVARAGAAHPERTVPFLSTREAFAIKADPALTAAWASGDMAARRRLLAAQGAAFARAPIAAGMFGGKPLAAEQVEWFGSPADMARLLDWIRVHGDPVAQAILATAAGTDPATRARFDYVGFKGGSEPGVITLNYLVRTKAGEWLAVTGNWHRSDAETPTVTFAALMNRALALAADQPAATPSPASKP